MDLQVSTTDFSNYVQIDMRYLILVKAFCFFFFFFNQWDLGESLMFFVLIWYLSPLVKHENNSLGENTSTFTMPLDESLKNQSYGRNSG